MNISKLTVAELMALQVEVNNAVEALKTNAKADLDAGKVNAYFSLKKGRKSRFIANKETYLKLLEDTFEDKFEDLCVETRLIALTNAEKLVNTQFDKDEAKDILAQINECTDTKVSAPTLIYDPKEE